MAIDQQSHQVAFFNQPYLKNKKSFRAKELLFTEMGLPANDSDGDENLIEPKRGGWEKGDRRRFITNNRWEAGDDSQTRSYGDGSFWEDKIQKCCQKELTIIRTMMRHRTPAGQCIFKDGWKRQECIISTSIRSSLYQLRFTMDASETSSANKGQAVLYDNAQLVVYSRFVPVWTTDGQKKVVNGALTCVRIWDRSS